MSKRLVFDYDDGPLTVDFDDNTVVVVKHEQTYGTLNRSHANNEGETSRTFSLEGVRSVRIEAS